MRIAGIRISHPDKVLFPDVGLRKGDVACYYERVADHILPWLKGRPLTLQRFPAGVAEEGFYQKNAPDYFPDFIERVSIATQEGHNEQVVCNSLRTLLYLVNQDCLAFHIWLSRTDNLHCPDRVVIDLDPPDGDFRRLKLAARMIRRHFACGNIHPRVMTTGKRGLHVFWPSRRDKDFDAVRAQVKAQADELVSHRPDLLTTALPKAQRQDRIFIDYLRNAYGQTAICPYSLRPTPQATVATPIDWRELRRLSGADRYNQGNLFRRLAQRNRAGRHPVT